MKSNLSRRTKHSASVLCLLLFMGTDAFPYESDVHAGLTQWLALQAGFLPSQAKSIARGDQRLDSGMMDYVALSPEYACAAADTHVAAEIESRHFPASTPVPASAERRAVVPGGEAARQALTALRPKLPGKEELMLSKFGEALHPLQDSWAHRGVPSDESALPMQCDPRLASWHSPSSGGPESHAADLTYTAIDAAVSAARASYEAMVAYPLVRGEPRQHVDWLKLEPLVVEFAAAKTKLAKQTWFKVNGIEDTGFLGGISLPDGSPWKSMAVEGRDLPPLESNASIQHDAPRDVRSFFDALIEAWVAGKDTSAFIDPGKFEELSLVLQLWRVRDHGAASEFLHGRGRLSTARLRARAARLVSASGRVAAPSVGAAVFSLQPLSEAPTPLVPYVVRTAVRLKDAGAKGQTPPTTAFAFLRWRSAPYDTVVLRGERINETWKLTEVASVVEP